MRAKQSLWILESPHFLSNLTILSILHFQIRERLIKSYGLTQDDADEEWKVEESELKEILKPKEDKSADDCEALPSRKKLVRRMRKLGAKFIGKGDDEEKEESAQDKSSASDAKAEAEAEESKNYGYYVIDQTDRHNILLVEMMVRGCHCFDVHVLSCHCFISMCM